TAPAEPTDATEATEPTGPTEPPEPTAPTEPTEPTEPAGPTEPTPSPHPYDRDRGVHRVQAPAARRGRRPAAPRQPLRHGHPAFRRLARLHGHLVPVGGDRKSVV